ncbi:MAG: hypothetical protein U0V04_03610 [Spirosomataceae bacterium]|jgi:hypothetical protein
MKQKRREFLTLTSVLLSQTTFFGSYASVFNPSEFANKLSKGGLTQKAVNPLFFEDFEILSKPLTDLLFKADLSNALMSDEFCMIPFSQKMGLRNINLSYLIFKRDLDWKFVTQMSDFEFQTLVDFYETQKLKNQTLYDFLPRKMGIFNNMPGYQSDAGVYFFTTKIENDSARVNLNFAINQAEILNTQKTFKIN